MAGAWVILLLAILTFLVIYPILTLLFGARDARHNTAVALHEYLTRTVL